MTAKKYRRGITAPYFVKMLLPREFGLKLSTRRYNGMDDNILLSGDVIDEISGGGLKIIQNINYYRFTSDSVRLARFARSKSNDRVADFCAGSGIVGFQLYDDNKKIESVTFFEMQKTLSDMCGRSIALNNLNCFKVENVRLQELPLTYREYFSLIVCNPPYERAEVGFAGEREDIAVCRKELTVNLAEIIEAARLCLKFGGRFAFINRADRLAEAIELMQRAKLTPKRLQLVCARRGQKPYLMMLEGVKGGKQGIEVLPEAYADERAD